jgi:4-diphosphocytidyl-2-C-methyl-D-erythritol kinase
MSGSGSGCFGLYGTMKKAASAAAALKALRPGWWVQAAAAH